MSEINIFIDWALKKDHVAVIESKSEMQIKSSANLKFDSITEPNSAVKIKSNFALKFGSVQELLDLIKESFESVKSESKLNSFIESGAPYLLLHQLITNDFNVFIVDSHLIKDFRGEREKTDEKDAQYIRELYHQKPEIFKPLTLQDKDLIHAKYLVAKYIHFTKGIARLKNQQKAFERQFGDSETYKHTIKEWSLKKKEALTEVLPYLKEDIQKINIAGVGNVLSMQILASAHPNKFNSLSSFLAYCGYKGNVGTKYNRLAKTTAYQMASECVMHKNEKYYPLYLKVKEDLKQRFPEDRKAKINGKAINRLSTFLLKEIYSSVKS